MTPLAFALTLSFAAQGPVEITLGDFRGVGLADDETESFRARLEEELAASGIRAVPAEPAIEQDCYDELECIANAVAGRKAVVDVELVRVGPFLQVKVRMWDAEGNVMEDEDGMEDAEAFREGGAILPHTFAERLGATPPPEGGYAEEEDEVTSPDDTTVTEEFAPAPVEQPPETEGDPLLGYAGVGVAVVGGLLLAGGGLIALNEMFVLENAETLGDEKERARVLGPVGLVAAGVGVLAVGGGGALATLGFVGM
jgi:hypothetical protein